MTLNVLWVEEEPATLRYEWGIARQSGWNITNAQNVEQALTLAREQQFDLIVVDLILPFDDYGETRGKVEPEAGIRLLETIRSGRHVSATRSDVPLLVVTAVASPDRRAKALRVLASSSFYLTKPIDEHAFRAVVQHLTTEIEQSR